MNRLALLLTIALITTETSAQYFNGQIRIDSINKSYIFQITDKVIKPNITRIYYWFKSGHIHQTEGSYNGKLLHGPYKIIDSRRQLLEEGLYRFGVKTGVWRSWYSNGRLKSYIKINPLINVTHISEYDETGQCIKRGKEKYSLFTGYDVEFKNDTSSIRKFKKGVLLP